MKNIVRNRLFMSIYFADMLSNFGDVLYYLALMNYVLLLPNTKLALSLVTLSETIPIFTLLFAGIWADWTKNKVDTIIATQLFRVLLYMVIGFAMGFEPALWIVILAALINVLADIAGQYESMLYLPLSLRIVPQDDREAMVALRRGFGSILEIVFRSGGALLIGFMTYQHLAFLNAGTFLASALMMCGLRPALLKKSPKVDEMKEDARKGDKQPLLKETYQSLVKTYQLMKENPRLGFFTKMITIGNMIGISSTLTVLMLAEDADFVLYSAAMTLSLSVIVRLIGVVLGSFLAVNLFKKTDMLLIMKGIYLLSIFVYLAYFFHFILGVLFFLLLQSLLQGVIQPKMSADFYNIVPEDQLATVGAGVDTLSYVGLFLGQILVSVLVLLVSATIISAIFVLISILVLGYTVVESSRFEKQEGEV